MMGMGKKNEEDSSQSTPPKKAKHIPFYKYTYPTIITLEKEDSQSTPKKAKHIAQAYHFPLDTSATITTLDIQSNVASCYRQKQFANFDSEASRASILIDEDYSPFSTTTDIPTT